MTLAGFAMPGRPLARILCFAAILVLAAAALLQHFAALGEQEQQRTAIARYQRIAADLPRLTAASAALPAPATLDNPNLAMAVWQSRLAQLAGTHGLQLVSAEPQLADGRPSIMLELAGSTPGLLAFLFEVEQGAPAMTVARLEIAPAAAAENNTSEPPLRIRLQAQALRGAP